MNAFVKIALSLIVSFITATAGDDSKNYTENDPDVVAYYPDVVSPTKKIATSDYTPAAPSYVVQSNEAVTFTFNLDKDTLFLGLTIFLLAVSSYIMGYFQGLREKKSSDS